MFRLHVHVGRNTEIKFHKGRRGKSCLPGSLFLDVAQARFLMAPNNNYLPVGAKKKIILIQFRCANIVLYLKCVLTVFSFLKHLILNFTK